MSNPYSFLTFSGWKQVNRAALAGATADDILDYIETLCSPGGQMNDDGWTVDRDVDTFGLSLTPPSADLADDLRILLAGKAASIGTPTMLLVNGITALDSATTAVLLAGLAGGDAGGYSTINWDAADPVGSVGSGGWFSGYIRGFTCTTSSHITVWYNERALVICIDNNSANTIRVLFAGAFIDALSQNAGDAEANDFVYALSGSGSVATTGMNGLWGGLTANSATANRLFVHGSSDGHGHSVYRDPADGKWQPFTRESDEGYHQKTAGNRYVPKPTFLFAPGNATAGSKLVGVADGIFKWGANSLTNARLGDAMPIKIPAGGTPYTAGYFLSNGITTDAQNCFFQTLEDFQ